MLTYAANFVVVIPAAANGATGLANFNFAGVASVGRVEKFLFGLFDLRRVVAAGFGVGFGRGVNFGDCNCFFRLNINAVGINIAPSIFSRNFNVAEFCIIFDVQMNFLRFAITGNVNANRIKAACVFLNADKFKCRGFRGSCNHFEINAVATVSYCVGFPAFKFRCHFWFLLSKLSVESWLRSWQFLSVALASIFGGVPSLLPRLPCLWLNLTC